MLVSEIMTKDVLMIDREETVRKAAKLMSEMKVMSLIVTEEGDAVGILTESDILDRVIAVDKDPDILKVKRVMSAPLIVIEPDASIELAIDTMVENNIKKLPVVTAENKLVGIVTVTDILRNHPNYVAELAKLVFKPVPVIGG